MTLGSFYTLTYFKVLFHILWLNYRILQCVHFKRNHHAEFPAVSVACSEDNLKRIKFWERIDFADTKWADFPLLSAYSIKNEFVRTCGNNLLPRNKNRYWLNCPISSHSILCCYDKVLWFEMAIFISRKLSHEQNVLQPQWHCAWKRFPPSPLLMKCFLLCILLLLLLLCLSWKRI